jgi:hypothetical protein
MTGLYPCRTCIYLLTNAGVLSSLLDTSLRLNSLCCSLAHALKTFFAVSSAEMTPFPAASKSNVDSSKSTLSLIATSFTTLFSPFQLFRWKN